MKIKSAQDSRTSEIYTVKELLTLPDNSEILSHLVCMHCGCLLTLTHASQNQAAYLKTRNGQNHNPTCKDYFEHEERKELLVTGKTVAAKPKPKDKPQVNGRTTPHTRRKAVVRVIPSTDPQIALVDDTQSGHVRMNYRAINELSERLVGQTVVTGGYATEVKLSADQEHATIVLEFEKATLNVRLRPDIFQYQIGLFNRVKKLGDKLHSLRKQPEVVALLEIGVDSSGNLEAVLRDETTITFDDRPLSIFISTAK
ncbi:hypothetical protein [Lactiplantibacillus pentosus]|uniref:hypothetical protein n=1 Tax=Lactiplantibacillus pentosus TaxID=1589 RepID=UPI0008101652|nr:hypothetical protein [Lactiplantibacillus pentosus]